MDPRRRTDGGDDAFSRPLVPADLGLSEADAPELDGIFMVSDQLATVQFVSVRGNIRDPFRVLSSLMDVARAYGAKKLRVQATLANARLYDILVRRYGFVTEGSRDYLELLLD